MTRIVWSPQSKMDSVRRDLGRNFRAQTFLSALLG